MVVSRFPALSVQSPDLIGVGLARQNIESSRTRNRLAERTLGLQERQQQLAESQLQRQNALAARSGALAGRIAGLPAGQERSQAVVELTAIDPERGRALRGALESMDAAQLARTQRISEQIGKISLGFLSAPEEQQAAAWPRVRQAAIELGANPADIPEQFGPEALAYVQEQATVAQSVSDLAKQLPGRDVLSPEAEAQKVRIAQAGRAETTVNVGPQGQDFGDPPKDHVWARNPDGSIATEPVPDRTGFVRPIAVPIGAAARKEATEREAATAREERRATQAGIVIEDIDRLLDAVENSNVTGVFSLLSGIPGLAQADAQALVDTIRANVGFDQLQRMREASPTGGALGQVSEQENRLLQSVLGSLELRQSKEQVQFNLRRLRQQFNLIVHGQVEAPGLAPDIAPPDGRTIRFDEQGNRIQ